MYVCYVYMYVCMYICMYVCMYVLKSVLHWTSWTVTYVNQGLFVLREEWMFVLRIIHVV